VAGDNSLAAGCKDAVLPDAVTAAAATVERIFGIWDYRW